MFAVASTCNPADQVVAIGRCEREDRDEFGRPFARQGHQHEVWFHDLLALIGHNDFRGHAPQILAVVEHIGIGHMVEAIDGSLYAQQQFRVPYMLAHGSRHRRRVGEQTGKHRPIGGDNWIVRVEHIECRVPGVCIDQDLHAVANVVDAVIAEQVTARVRVPVGRGEGIHQPVDSAILADHHVRIRVEREKRRELLHTFAQPATHQQSTL